MQLHSNVQGSAVVCGLARASISSCPGGISSNAVSPAESIRTKVYCFPPHSSAKVRTRLPPRRSAPDEAAVAARRRYWMAVSNSASHFAPGIATDSAFLQTQGRAVVGRTGAVARVAGQWVRHSPLATAARVWKLQTYGPPEFGLAFALKQVFFGEQEIDSHPDQGVLSDAVTLTPAGPVKSPARRREPTILVIPQTGFLALVLVEAAWDMMR